MKVTQAEDNVKRLKEQLAAQDKAHKNEMDACAAKTLEAETKTARAEGEVKRLKQLLATADKRVAQARTKAAEAREQRHSFVEEVCRV